MMTPSTPRLIRNQCTVNIKKIKILNLKLNQTFKGGERLARPLQSGQGSGCACYAGGLAPCELFGFQTIQEKVNGWEFNRHSIPVSPWVLWAITGALYVTMWEKSSLKKRSIFVRYKQSNAHGRLEFGGPSIHRGSTVHFLSIFIKPIMSLGSLMKFQFTCRYTFYQVKPLNFLSS